MLEISNHLHSKVLEHTERADLLCSESRWADAIEEYNRAWELLPEPRAQWNAALWLLGAIGDAAFRGEYFATVIESLEYALLACPNAVGNPFIHLRLGQAYFEKERLDEAANELMRAYSLEGFDIFIDEDQKYLEFLKSRAKLD